MIGSPGLRLAGGGALRRAMFLWFLCSGPGFWGLLLAAAGIEAFWALGRGSARGRGPKKGAGGRGKKERGAAGKPASYKRVPSR